MSESGTVPTGSQALGRTRPAPLILVVEDDAQVAGLLRVVLGDGGYQVVTAADGLTGLARIQAGGVDLVLLDLMLPELDGREVCWKARLHAPAGEPHLPILMITALTRREDQRAGFLAGADDYVTKPFDIDTLLARVEVWLRLRQQSQELIAAREAAERRALRAQIEAVRLTARELADKVNNDLAGVAGVLRLLESYSAAPEGLRGMLPEALAALEHACQAITRLHSVTRIETHATPFGPALDLERSVSTPEDPRPLVAGEGESSQEADSGAGPLQLGYEEMLRTVGAWLDVADHDLVLLDVSPQAAAIETVGPAGRDRFVIGEIAQYARARRRLRGQGEEHPTDGTVLRREWILRVIGAELDRVGEARYDLIVTRSSVRVDGAAGYHRIFDGDTLARLIEEATRRRLDGAPAPSPPP